MFSLRNHLPDLRPDSLVSALRDPRMASADLKSLVFLARYDTLKALEKAGAATNSPAHAMCDEVCAAGPLNAAVFNALARCVAKGEEAAAGMKAFLTKQKPPWARGEGEG